MLYTSTQVFEAVQVIPENYDILDSWGVDYTSPTMEIPDKWVVRATPSRIVAILSEEDFLEQYSPHIEPETQENDNV